MSCLFERLATNLFRGSLITLLLWSSPTFAQSAVWTRTLSDPNETISGGSADGQGNMYLNGYRSQPPASRSVHKLTIDGNVAWTFTGGPGQLATTPYAVNLDSAGDVILGEVLVGTTTLQWTKLSHVDGSVLWTTQHVQPGTASVLLAPVLNPSNGDSLWLADYDGYRIVLLRLDPAGNVRWDTYSVAPTGPQGNWNSVEGDAQGGAAYDFYTGGSSYQLVRVDAQGQIAWIRNYVDPRGPNIFPNGLTIDSQGTTHWYVSVSGGPVYVPCVEVRYDMAGNLIGTHDLPMYVDWNGHSRVGHRIVLAGRSYTSQRVLIEVRDDAGQIAWSDYVDPPPGYYSAYSAPSVNGQGGLYLHLAWQVLVPQGPPMPAIEEVRRYDSSGHPLWSNGLGQGPLAPDSSSIVIHNALGQQTSITKYALVATGVCFGDDTLAACPCGNASATTQMAGCAHSLGVGASLSGAGVASLSGDTLSLSAQSATGSSMLLAQGNAIAPGGGVPLGDGLRCVAGTLIRIGTKSLAGGGATWPAVGDLSISVRGGVIAPGTRTYQGVYRNAAAFCTPSTQNQTNGIVVHWTP